LFIACWPYLGYPVVVNIREETGKIVNKPPTEAAQRNAHAINTAKEGREVDKMLILNKLKARPIHLSRFPHEQQQQQILFINKE
jgi:hypothetical protein